MSSFKYTTDKDRILFANYIHKLNIINLMNMIKEIPWDKYSFNDNCSLLHINEENQNNNNTYASNFEPYEMVIKPVKAKCSQVPYSFFGGSAYYLYKKTEPDTNHYMDPTADVDIEIDIPIIQTIGEEEPLHTYYKSILKKGKTDLSELNEMVLHYLKWLLNEVYELFQKQYSNPNVYEELEKYEYKKPNLYTKNLHDKIHFSIIEEFNMTKIQIECQVKHMKQPDHLMEFVIVTNPNEQITNTWDMGSVLERKFKKGLIVNKNDLFVHSYDQLISHNINSITNRMEVSLRHKLYNHIARLQYLNTIYPNYKTPITNEIKQLLYFLWTNRVNMELYNYSDKENKEFMLSMIGNFLERFKKENNERGTFIVSYMENEKTKHKLITNIELLKLYEPLEIKRGRELFRSRATTAKNKRSKGFARVMNYKQTQTRKTSTKSPTRTKSQTRTKSKSPTRTKSQTKTKSKSPTTH